MYRHLLPALHSQAYQYVIQQPLYNLAVTTFCAIKGCTHGHDSITQDTQTGSSRHFIISTFTCLNLQVVVRKLQSHRCSTTLIPACRHSRTHTTHFLYLRLIGQLYNGLRSDILANFTVRFGKAYYCKNRPDLVMFGPFPTFFGPCLGLKIGAVRLFCGDPTDLILRSFYLGDLRNLTTKRHALHYSACYFVFRNSRN